MKTVTIKSDCKRRVPNINILRKKSYTSLNISQSSGSSDTKIIHPPEASPFAYATVEAPSTNLKKEYINVDSFLNGCESNQKSAINNKSQTDMTYNDNDGFIYYLNDQQLIVELMDGAEDRLILNDDTKISCAVPLSAVTLSNEDRYAINNINQTDKQLAYECKIPACLRKFATEKDLLTHKAKCHKNINSILGCPVKNKDVDGTETSCGRLFYARKDLVDHLNSEHTLDDAPFCCEVCNRRFFWASGFRQHLRSHRPAEPTAVTEGGWRRAAPVQLRCSWPNCGRAFAQPCRLREHARLHTGDRPYACQHPGCSWSFRTASKLVRHSRKHTGDRRHACALCGSAFLRAEHLRDHRRRRHAARRSDDAQTAETSSSSIQNNDSGDVQSDRQFTVELLGEELLVKFPEISKKLTTADIIVDSTNSNNQNVANNDDATYQSPTATDEMISAVPAEEDSDSVLEVRVSEEDRCARTHCTWPLSNDCKTMFQNGVGVGSELEEGALVELNENSESNIYSVRSDLFLHGNVLINEDSQSIPSVRRSEECGRDLTLDTDLGLLDSTPSIDLMQEEMLYIDGTTFQVSLLSGEDLS